MNKGFEQQQRRRSHYVDHVIQGWFLIGLITLEVLLFGIGLYIVYQNMTESIEMQLFQAHASYMNGSELLFNELLRVLPWILVANVIAVLITNRIWASYLRNIIRSLRQMLSSAAKFDFRDISGQLEGKHEVIDKGVAWIRRERERNQVIKAAIAELDVDSDPEQARQILEKIQKVLS